MKKIKFLSTLIILFSAFTFTSCDNEPIDSALNPGDFGGGGGGGGNGGGNPTYFVKAKVNGVQKSWNSGINAVYSPDMGTLLILSLNSDNFESMSLIVSNEDNLPLTTQVYNLDWATVNCTNTIDNQFFSSDYDDFTSSPGDITLTEINTANKTMKGTFNFIGKNDDMTVSNTYTDGQFSIQYTEQ